MTGIIIAAALGIGLAAIRSYWHWRRSVRAADSLFGNWTCHVCDRLRPDSKIAVISFSIRDLPGAIRNVRYCADNDACEAEAYRWRETQRMNLPRQCGNSKAPADKKDWHCRRTHGHDGPCAAERRDL